MPTNHIDRALDPGEAFFFLADRISCLNFVLIAERRGMLDAERIHAGLALLKRQNPLLRAKISWTDEAGLRFESATGATIELECRETGAADWQMWIERELARPFTVGEAPLVRCQYLHWTGVDDSPRSVLALTFHHAIADGRSGGEMLRQLLDFLATGSAPEPPTAGALPPMGDLFPARFRWPAQPESAKRVMDLMMADYRRHGRVHRMPLLANAAAARSPRFIRLTLPPDVTQRLLFLSRQHGASVHGALCAAQLLAQFRVLADGEKNGEKSCERGSEKGSKMGRQREALFLSCPVDMRPHLEPVPPAMPTGLYISLVSAAFALEQNTDFWTLAGEVIRQTRAQLARGEGHIFFNMYGLHNLPITPAFEALFARNLLATLHHTAVSNIGRVATVESDRAVETISFALCPMPYQALFSAVSTYQDQLIVNLNYDAGKLPAQIAGAIANTMRELLLQASEA